MAVKALHFGITGNMTGNKFGFKFRKFGPVLSSSHLYTKAMIFITLLSFSKPLSSAIKGDYLAHELYYQSKV
jgi:hypothetical protein